MQKNIATLFQEISNRFRDRPAFGTRDENKRFVTRSFGETREMVMNLACALVDTGLEFGEHVGLICDNRYEWIIADLAVILSGAADVPRGTDVTDHDITYILNHAEVRILFVENESVLEKIRKNSTSLPGIKTIVLIEGKSETDKNILKFNDLLKKGEKLRASGDRRVEERISRIQGGDLFTLIYTSGTTGAPKGVMLTHDNMLSQYRNTPVPVDTKDRALSILPIWHIFERAFEMLTLANGACTYYTNIRNIKEDMQLVKPTLMASAPRLWESIYLGILTKLEKSGSLKKKMFGIAYFFAEKFQGARRYLTSREIRLERQNFFIGVFRMIYETFRLIAFALPYLFFDFLVLSKIRQATGGSLRGSVSGGGALPYHVDLFFNNIGIPVLEGYGMTETCPVISVRTFDNLVVGTVGQVIGETEIRLVDLNTYENIFESGSKNGFGVKGEIYVKGPQVMKGYYKNPEATQKVLQDGWLNTGDLGVMTFNNCLKIVGRSKETIVLLGGENVEPVPIENKLLESPFIDQCMVVGQDKKYLGALIVVNKERFKEFGESHDELATNKKVQSVIESEIKKKISTENGFKSFEKVVASRILPKPFEPNEELTAKLSVKRHVVAEKYKRLVDEMFL